MPEPCRGGAPSGSTPSSLAPRMSTRKMGHARNPKSAAVRVVDARSGKEACSSFIGISDTSTLPAALDPPR